MATNTSVIVLSPNGRRQTVKVTPNTTILQIIEEVCRKQGYNPEEYDIKHHKKILDTSSTLRFSGLPNNAQLELLQSTRSRAETEVTLGIHFEDGNRLLGTFTPNSTLWDVLSKLSPDDLAPEKNCVIVYMRREIYGTEAFKETDLRSLGLTNGRAMLRLIHRSPGDLKIQANISTPIPSKPTEEKPYMRKFQRVESPVRTIPKPQEHSQNENIIEDLHDNNKNDFALARKQDSYQAAIKRKEISTKKQENLFDVVKNEKKKRQSPAKEPEPMDVDLPTQPTIKLEDEFLFLGARNAMAFSLETAQRVATEDLPEDFFELTIDDVKKLLKDIKRRRLQLEEGQLLTSTMRNLEESKKQLRNLNTYKRSIIRIQFPDRIILQGTFLPAEDIGTVIEFVREYLEDRTIEFHLFTTPPKNILPRESRLIEIGCVPGALLHFGTNHMVKTDTFLRKDVLNKLTSSSVASLAASKMRQQGTRSVSSKLSDDEMEDTLIYHDNDVNVGASTSADPPATYVDYDKPSTSSAPQQLPKWFKPSK